MLRAVQATYSASNALSHAWHIGVHPAAKDAAVLAALGDHPRKLVGPGANLISPNTSEGRAPSRAPEDQQSQMATAEEQLRCHTLRGGVLQHERLQSICFVCWKMTYFLPVPALQPHEN
eukprot:s1906_g15.t1